MRTTELDSLLTGRTRVWESMSRPTPVLIALCDRNSSTNEIVRKILRSGADFTPAASYLESSSEVMEFVAANEGAIGVVGNAWLWGNENRYAVVRLLDPETTSDTLMAGQYVPPAQAYIYSGSYPLSTKVYIYNRELLRTVGLGFISYTNSIAGQRIFQNLGLVPATMPVRIVRTTSERVSEQ
jgi:phosphate transport system substrate-binding protein